MLPDALKARAEAAATANNQSFAEFVRLALDAALVRQNGDKMSGRAAIDPVFTGFDSMVSQMHPGPTDGAANHDRYLYGE